MKHIKTKEHEELESIFKKAKDEGRSLKFEELKPAHKTLVKEALSEGKTSVNVVNISEVKDVSN